MDLSEKILQKLQLEFNLDDRMSAIDYAMKRKDAILQKHISVVYPIYAPFLLLNEKSEDGKLHLRAIDNHLRVFVHYDALGLGRSPNARSAHDCRRTYASLEYLSGTDIRTIKQQMGHTSEAQTWEYIKDVVDAEEHKTRLRGGNMLSSLA